MTWLNEYEVREAVALFEGHYLLGPASQTLANLVEWANDNSDGWPYWRKPSNASAKLQAIIADARREVLRGAQEPTVATGPVYAAYRPIKAFLTRQGVLHSTVLVPLPVVSPS